MSLTTFICRAKLLSKSRGQRRGQMSGLHRPLVRYSLLEIREECRALIREYDVKLTNLCDSDHKLGTQPILRSRSRISRYILRTIYQRPAQAAGLMQVPVTDVTQPHSGRCNQQVSDKHIQSFRREKAFAALDDSLLAFAASLRSNTLSSRRLAGLSCIRKYRGALPSC